MVDICVSSMHDRSMTLDEYLTRHTLTQEAFAGLLMDVRPESAPMVYGTMVGKWRRGLVAPSCEHVAAIFRATHGMVTPVDLWKVCHAANPNRGRRGT